MTDSFQRYIMGTSTGPPPNGRDIVIRIIKTKNVAFLILQSKGNRAKVRSTAEALQDKVMACRTLKQDKENRFRIFVHKDRGLRKYMTLGKAFCND